MISVVKMMLMPDDANAKPLERASWCAGAGISGRPRS